MKKFSFFAFALLLTGVVSAQTIIYSNNFESGAGTATIVGNGVIETSATAGFGSVFHNAAGGQATRANYLLLPVDVLGNAQIATNKELTIAFWVNKGTAINYFYSPIFTAYGAAPLTTGNTWPMLALQSRLLTQLNCAGWNDFIPADNVKAANTETTVWLDDAAWHYYTATFTATSVSVYIDGVVQNSWNVSGADGHTTNGLFSNGGDLKYICLGGNQAWNWGDPDAAYLFDDLAIYANALTPTQINAIITAKRTTTALKQTISDSNSEVVSQEFFTTNGAKAGTDFAKLKSGIYIKKALYNDGSTKSSKTVKVEAN
ncbi:MAG: hypothetical protein PHT07_14100 [Paludibacter sp.]|nr:hypothetical protein [Paludibacter sp.]